MSWQLRIESSKESVANERTVEGVKKSKFLYLSLELPISPLFKDANNESMIPQVPLFVLLERFNGENPEVRSSSLFSSFDSPLFAGFS